MDRGRDENTQALDAASTHGRGSARLAGVAILGAVLAVAVLLGLLQLIGHSHHQTAADRPAGFWSASPVTGGSSLAPSPTGSPTAGLTSAPTPPAPTAPAPTAPAPTAPAPTAPPPTASAPGGPSGAAAYCPPLVAGRIE
jgi:hypothetical protein